MARRGGGRASSPSRRSPSPSARRPAPAPVQTKAPATVPQQPTAVASPSPSMGGGMMANIASTAAGVAIGHTVGHALTGAFSGGSDAPAPVENSAAPQQYQAPGQQQQSANACEREFQRFIECTQEQSDISLCEGFNQVFKDCKVRYAGAGY